ncbi:MAG TPA: hypothetical protein VF624_02990 [Tepidisphaeraceae bacterium]|jgi:hypothetical protein
MIRPCAAAVLALMAIGCSPDAPQTVRTPVDQTLFGPASMRLHPAFTKVDDFDSDGRVDGLEAVVELQDQFGDPTKGAGRVVFELFEYKPYQPDVRGPRLVAPWEGRLDSMEDQRARWNTVNRAYIFQLAWPQISDKGNYVLAATFELTGGSRFFNQVILEGRREAPAASGPPALPPVSPSLAPPSREPSSTKRPVDQEPASAPTTAHTPPARADQP